MKTLDELLAIDASVAEGSVMIFKELPPSLDCANAGMELFETTATWIQKYESANPAQARFDEAAQELGVSGPDLFKLIRNPPAPSESASMAKARGADKDIAQIIGYRTLLQLAYRSYRSGLTDLRRLKLTAAAGHLRVEVESASLIVLFFDEPSFAERWINPSENQRRFFSDSQPKVKANLKPFELTNAYDHGSAVAQHARFGSAARGLRMNGHEVTVLDQEFDPESPVTFHLGIAYFLRIQVRIFNMLCSRFKDLQSEEAFKGALDKYQDLEGKVWWVVERKYAKEIADFSM
jgi:hypothetical protein